MKSNILITGASRGLGYALAEKYLEMGFCVYACMREIKADAYSILKKKYMDCLHLIAMDISNTESVKSAFNDIKERTEHLDIIINNAGIHSEDSSSVLEELAVDNCLEVFNVNTLGPLRVIKEFVKLLENGRLKILANISSEAGSISTCGREKEFDYCMSKAALNMQSVMLQNYLGHRNIKVLAIHPGWIRSDMGGPDAYFSTSQGAKYVADVIEKYGAGPDGPIYVDNNGIALKF